MNKMVPAVADAVFRKGEKAMEDRDELCLWVTKPDALAAASPTFYMMCGQAAERFGKDHEFRSEFKDGALVFTWARKK